ncbi:TIR domain-containing protein [Gallibacterium anatis]|uniref:TIR domain-containing protein n=1 Tax=Gallibacterium anatis TaxID=750 RepID=A0AAX3XD81_9PAST|nr:TIR domain-containing protein [Gallibacterium anatis]MDK9431417.1 TIR domain-containing protein [Gallibacterium anatis]MDK9561811.1 TIR domain-containing protein [Gallibacterium anatis]WIM79505.1 TIR domain-containing protein [Gallibacterium anatis]
MTNRTKNYTAFYVAEPFNESNLGANQKMDFCYYNLLKAWKGRDSSFPFVNAHEATYNVRDGSKWETLKQRLHERLNVSKNIVLFLSSETKNSNALREEIEYGISKKELPVIVIYPEYSEKADLLNKDTTDLKPEIKALWNKLPKFRDLMGTVPTLHIPLKKDLIRSALIDQDFTVQNKCNNNYYWYKL